MAKKTRAQLEAEKKKKQQAAADKAQAKENASIANDFKNASDVYASSGLQQTLGRQDPNVPQDQLDFLKTLSGQVDPNSANYAGKRSQEMTDQLGLMQSMQGRTQETADLLKMMQGGLAGLNAQENQALREQANRENTRAYQTALSNLQANQAKMGVRGAAAAAQMFQANKGFMQQRDQTEQDLLVKNIDIQDKRRGQYADVLGGAETREAQRRNDYSSALTGAEKLEADKLAAAQQNYNTGLQNRNDYVNSREQFNILQGNAEAAAKASGITGIANYGLNKKLGLEEIGAMKSYYKKGGASSKTNSKTNVTYNYGGNGGNGGNKVTDI